MTDAFFSGFVRWKRYSQEDFCRDLIKQREIELSCDISTGQYQSS